MIATRKVVYEVADSKIAQIQLILAIGHLSTFIAQAAAVVVGRRPHPDPNFASYVLPGRPHRLAVALPRAA